MASLPGLDMSLGLPKDTLKPAIPCYVSPYTAHRAQSELR